MTKRAIIIKVITMDKKELDIMEEEFSESEVDSVEESPKYVEKATLSLPSEHLALILFKPRSTMLIAVIFAALFVLMGEILTIVLGLFILAFAAFVQLKVKDYPTLEVYQDFVLVYKLESDTLVRRIDYKDVEEWTCKDNEGKSNCVVFKLYNGETIYKDTFLSGKAYRLFRKLMGDKESRVVQHQKMVERNKKVKPKFKFKLPFKWPFGNK